MTDTPLPRHPLLRSVASAALTIAAFFYASAIFLCAQKQLRHLPPTTPSGIGRVTIEHASKAHDYLSFALFILVAGAGTVALRVVAERALRRFVIPTESDRLRARDALLFASPFLLAPFLWLTTAKEGWTLVLPVALALAALAWRRPSLQRALVAARSPEEAPFVALITCEVASWILFRYLSTGKRIAHIPTLFLEIIFVVFFLAVGIAAALLAARLLTLIFGTSAARSLAVVALTLWPFLLLLPFGIALMPTPTVLLIVGGLIVLTAFVFARRSDVHHLAPRVARAVRWLVVPAMIFAFSYASTASLSTWLDLFHRGETLGPASDYLRGRAPYRDVFVLHGLLEDGLLDSWLMTFFGRDAHVALARITILGATTLPILYLLSLATFDSVALALASVALGLFTFVDNQRIVFHLLVVLLLLLAVRHRRAWAFAAGAASALALFFSLDIGLYALGGSVAALFVFACVPRGRESLPVARVAALYALGVVAGTLPFVLYLASHDAVGAFLSTSFVEVPAVIDAVWSLPFPDLGATFRSDLSLRTLSDFVLGEKIRFILNPLVLAIGAAFVVARAWRGRIDATWCAAVVLVGAALFAQRSALGRADFQHQYFAAYLLAPILILLAREAIGHVRAWRDEPVALPFFALILLIVLVSSFAFLWVPDLLNSKIDSIVGYRPRVSAETYADPKADAVAMRVLSVRAAVAERVRPNEPIFDFSNQPALYFFADRPNATRFYQVPIASPLVYQNEVISELARTKPKVILRGSPEGFDRFDGISNEIRAPQLAAFIDTNYALDRRVRGIELWRVRTATPRLQLAKRIVVPKAARARATEALIFPSVGSVTGVGGSLWRSDLSITNPYETAIDLRLRYDSNRGHIEKSITVPAGHTIVLRDIAALFFAQPESRGACVIRYDDAARPIATLTGYDASREGFASTELPLDSSWRAVANSKRDRLVVNGAAESPTRRVNVTVINAGNEPLQFELYARGSDGARVSQPISGSLPEDASYLLVDASRQLSVMLDGTVTLEVRVKSGEAIAYVSVIDGATGMHFSLPAAPVTMP